MHAVGAAESHADSYPTVDDRAFIGDLAGAVALSDWATR
jgi:hypothetical protein